MAEAIKNLGQLLPDPASLQILYTAPPATSVVVSSIVVCNTDEAASEFRIAHAIGGAADEAKQYLYFGERIPGHKTFAVTLGITLGAGDVIRVMGNGRLAFNAYGSEIT